MSLIPTRFRDSVQSAGKLVGGDLGLSLPNSAGLIGHQLGRLVSAKIASEQGIGEGLSHAYLQHLRLEPDQVRSEHRTTAAIVRQVREALDQNHPVSSNPGESGQTSSRIAEPGKAKQESAQYRDFLLAMGAHQL